MKFLLLLILVAFVALSGCRKPDSTPKMAPFVIQGGPSIVYDSARPKIQKIISAQTEIVRVDNDGGMVLRFSIQSAVDNSARLVEVNLQKEGESESRVSISSEKFSFIPSKSHDAIDSSVEISIAGVFKNGG